MNDFDHLKITLSVEGKEIELHFVFLENGDLTACFIKGHQFRYIDRHDPARKRVPVNGMAARNPKDEPDRDYAMRLATWRACCNLDGVYQYNQENNGHDGWGLGPLGKKIYSAFREWQLGKKIYSAFREWQFEKNSPKLAEIASRLHAAILETIVNFFQNQEEKEDERTPNA